MASRRSGSGTRGRSEAFGGVRARTGVRSGAYRGAQGHLWARKVVQAVSGPDKLQGPRGPMCRQGIEPRTGAHDAGVGEVEPLLLARRDAIIDTSGRPVHTGTQISGLQGPAGHCALTDMPEFFGLPLRAQGKPLEVRRILTHEKARSTLFFERFRCFSDSVERCTVHATRAYGQTFSCREARALRRSPSAWTDSHVRPVAASVLQPSGGRQY